MAQLQHDHDEAKNLQDTGKLLRPLAAPWGGMVVGRNMAVLQLRHNRSVYSYLYRKNLDKKFAIFPYFFHKFYYYKYSSLYILVF